MNVVLKNVDTKKYRLTLKMMKNKRWHEVEYIEIIKKLECVYPELKNNIERAYL